jgi:hypothetical protein
MKRVMLPNPMTVSDSHVATVSLNHGRWVAQCPFCNGCEFAREDELFICQECYNKSVGHSYIKAPLPDNRETIENAVGKRPEINQNWEPGETIEQLIKDNKTHMAEVV